MGGLLANARVAGRRRRDCRCALRAAGRGNGILGAMMVLCFPCDHQTRTDLQVGRHHLQMLGKFGDRCGGAPRVFSIPATQGPQSGKGGKGRGSGSPKLADRADCQDAWVRAFPPQPFWGHVPSLTTHVHQGGSFIPSICPFSTFHHPTKLSARQVQKEAKIAPPTTL